MSKISVVIPVYNEEENIKTFLERTVATINKIKIDYQNYDKNDGYCFVCYY